MGMTIEEKAIKTLNEIIDEGWLISDMEKCTAIDACELGISAIKKLDKIEQIIKDWEGGCFSDAVGCLRVKAVLNGNDD